MLNPSLISPFLAGLVEVKIVATRN